MRQILEQAFLNTTCILSNISVCLLMLVLFFCVPLLVRLMRGQKAKAFICNAIVCLCAKFTRPRDGWFAYIGSSGQLRACMGITARQ